MLPSLPSVCHSSSVMWGTMGDSRTTAASTAARTTASVRGSVSPSAGTPPNRFTSSITALMAVLK